MNLKIMKIVHHELQSDFTSISFICDKTETTKSHIWRIIKLLKAMQLLDERYSYEKANVKVYRLKTLMTFEQFIDYFTERVY